MSLIKVALVGAGGMGNVHSTAYSGISNAAVISVVDICRDKAEKIACSHGAAVYDSIDEMLEKEKPDMVDICTPTYLHPEMAIKALANKAHVLCEKPMALNTGDAKHMLETARENGMLLMVGQVLRFWPEYIYLKQVFDNGTYGKLKQIAFSRVGQRPKWSWENWMMSVEKSGRAPLDLHIHDTDFIVHMLGKPKAVKSCSIEEGSVISYIFTQYLYDNRIVTAEGAWYDQALPFSMSYRASFEKAVLDYRDDKLVLYPEEGEILTIHSDEIEKVSTGINVSSVGAYESEIQYFINCIKNGAQPTVASPVSTLDCLDVVLKEIESAKTDQTLYF